ncbi:MAG: hypothetical protein ABIT76_14285 [Chthoniobacterales bacterium]
MSRYLPVILTASLALGFSACQTPQTTTVETTETHSVNQSGRKPSDQMPTPTPRPTVETTTTTENTPPTIEPAVTPMPTPVVQDYPTASAVEGKPGFVKSPFGGAGIVDVRGYPPGTEVKDPYTGKVFLVP